MAVACKTHVSAFTVVRILASFLQDLFKDREFMLGLVKVKGSYLEKASQDLFKDLKPMLGFAEDKGSASVKSSQSLVGAASLVPGRR